ncbi:unannotated protein [freshwater metagenome]|uniref:Unannotated protein n=1 Tax=freshwater metagenome TaxID=449393 RepID=A0A6J7QQ05_9ZZZZ
MLGAAVVVDLRAGSSGPGHAHAPVVVLGPAALDAVERHAHGAVPDVDGLVVVVVHGDPQLLGGESVAAVGRGTGEQLPCEGNRLGLEVVAEREIAGHLKEGGVARGLAHLLDVEGAHALLHADGAVVQWHGLAEEVGLKRHHSGIDEQQRGVIEDQRRRGHDRVPIAREVVEEPSTDLGGLHQCCPSRSSGCAGDPAGRNPLASPASDPNPSRTLCSTSVTRASKPWSVGW